MLVIKAPAKINWFLSVLGRRDDGYHDIESVMQCVDLYDVLIFDRAETLEVISDMSIPMKENLSYKAAVLLREITGYRSGARIRLEKSIPPAAGLGGGSSDAAHTLVGLNRLWNTGLGENELMEIASGIGSDVPFFLSGPLAFVSGRGERVTRMETAASFDMLLAKPQVSVSTAWAYSNYRAKLTNARVDIRLFCHALKNRDYDGLRSMAVNDLEAPVMSVHSELAEIKRTMAENRAELTLMSGSGSAVFGVFQSASDAGKAAGSLGNCWHRVVKTLCEI